MLSCASCGTTGSGSAWHWIGLLQRAPGGIDLETVCFCPVCAEAKFGYFSKQRARRLETSDDSHGE